MDSRELNNFLTARGADSDCPACGHDGQWAGIEGDQDLKLSTADGAGQISVAGMICQNCGFVRLHSVDVIRHALQNPDIGPAE